MPELRFQRSGDQLITSLAEREQSVAWSDVAPTDTTAARIRNEAAKYGRDLFDTVFSGELSGVLSDMRPGERLLLVADDPAVGAVGWEYMRDGKGLLAEQYTLVRGIPEAERKDGHAFEPPLEILAIPVSPVNDAHGLNVEREYRNLREIVEKTGKALKLTRVRPPTLTSLEKTLSPGTTTLIHFMGHSHSDGSQSYLILEDLHGWRQEIEASQFADAIAGDVLLVVLNSCLSATAGGHTEFSNIALGLVRQGIPYALGMQFTMPDEAASILSQELFTFLFQGRDIEDAMRRTRRALLTGVRADREWIAGIPVLYTSQRERQKPLHLHGGQPEVHPDPQRLEQTYHISDLREEPLFVGRSKEIRSVLSALLGEEDFNFVMLHGLGGTGKTTLARVVAERVGWHYGDSAFAFSFEIFSRPGQDVTIEDRPPQFTDSFYMGLAQFYGIDMTRKEFQQDASLSQLKGEIIQRRKHKRSLLIIDNFETLLDALTGDAADDAHEMADFVRRLGEGQGDIILTSRTALPPGWGRFAVIEVGGLDDEAGAKLFLSMLGRHRKASAPLDGRKTLSERVGGHPLSIQLLAARFNDASSLLAKFLNEVEEELKLAEQIIPGNIYGHKRQRTLYACLTYSVRRLSKAQKAALRAVALFQRFFTDESAGVVLGDSNHDLHALARLSLLIRNTRSVEDGTINELEIHPTVRWYVAHFLEPPDRTMRERYGRVYRDLASRAGEEFNRSAKLRTQVTEGFADFENIIRSQPGQYLDQDSIVNLANTLGTICHQRGEPLRAVELFEQALKYCETSDNQKGQRLAALAEQGLASVNMQQGRPDEAMELFRRALETFKRLGEKEQIGKLKNEMASALLSQGQPEKALALNKEALKIFGNLRDELQLAVASVGIADARIQLGQPHLAMRLYKEALVVFERMGDLLAAAHAQSGIATVLRQLWRSEEALKEYEQVLEKYRKLGSPSGIASTNFAIAEAQVQLGRYQEAAAWYSRIQKEQEEIDDQYGLLVTRSGSAEVEQRQARHSDAFNSFAQVLLDALRLGDKRTAALARKGMADAQLLQGRYKEAIPLYEDALKSASDLNDPREKAIIQFQFSQSLVAANRFAEALEMLWDAYKTVRRRRFERDTKDFAQHLVYLKQEGLGIEAFDKAWMQAIAESQPKWLLRVRAADADLPEEERAVRAFIKTRTATEANELVEERQAIYFAPKTEQAIETLCERAKTKGDAEHAEYLRSELTLLRDIKHSQRMEAIRAFLNADNWAASYRVLKRRHAVLLAPEAEAVLQSSIRRSKRKKELDNVKRLQQELLVLQEARTYGMDMAFRRVEFGFVSQQEMEEAHRALPQFLLATNCAEARAAVESHPILTHSGTVRLLRELISEAAREGERQAIGFLQTRLYLLESVASRGIEASFANVESAIMVQHRLREVGAQMASFASSADYESFRHAAQDIGIDEGIGLLSATMRRASHKEIVIGGVEILKRVGGEAAERALSDLLHRAGNRKLEDLYVEALRGLSDRAAKYAAEWVQQRPPADELEIHVGADLVPLFDPEQGGTMLEQIKKIREELSAELEFKLPYVRVRDDLWMCKSEYEIVVAGDQVFSEKTDEQLVDADVLSQRLKQVFTQHRERISAR
jgi:tetratricopeptide (TPR) repeat protein